MIELSLDDEEVVKRLLARVECVKCGSSFGPTKKPLKPGVCDICGGELVKRKDDTPVLIQKRLDVYHDETEPLLEYYKPRSIVHSVDAKKSVKEVFSGIKNIVENFA